MQSSSRASVNIPQPQNTPFTTSYFLNIFTSSILVVTPCSLYPTTQCHNHKTTIWALHFLGNIQNFKEFLDRTQGRSVYFWRKNKSLLPAGIRSMDHPGHSLVTTLTKLSQLTKTGKIFNNKVNSQVSKKCNPKSHKKLLKKKEQLGRNIATIP